MIPTGDIRIQTRKGTKFFLYILEAVLIYKPHFYLLFSVAFFNLFFDHSEDYALQKSAKDRCYVRFDRVCLILEMGRNIRVVVRFQNC